MLLVSKATETPSAWVQTTVDSDGFQNWAQVEILRIENDDVRVSPVLGTRNEITVPVDSVIILKDQVPYEHELDHVELGNPCGHYAVSEGCGGCDHSATFPITVRASE